MGISNRRAVLQLDTALETLEKIKDNVERRRRYHEVDERNDPDATFTDSYTSDMMNLVQALFDAETKSEKLL